MWSVEPGCADDISYSQPIAGRFRLLIYSTTDVEGMLMPLILASPSNFAIVMGSGSKGKNQPQDHGPKRGGGQESRRVDSKEAKQYLQEHDSA